MKTISAGLTTHIAGEVTTLALCAQLKLKSGTIRGYTAHDLNIAIDIGDGNGTITYKAKGSFMPSAERERVDMAPGSSTATFMLDDDEITRDDLYRGIYDGAEIRLFMVNYADLSQGVLKRLRGFIGPVDINDIEATAHFTSMMTPLGRPQLEIYTPLCKAKLGDTRCGVRLDPPIWTSSTTFQLRQARDAKTGHVVKPNSFNDRHFKCVQSGVSAGVEPVWNTTLGGQTTDGGAIWEAIRALSLIANVGSAFSAENFLIVVATSGPDTLFSGGRVVFSTGTNSGQVNQVKRWTLTEKRVELYERMRYDVSSGDQVKLFAGCDKAITANCSTEFDNEDNFRGEPNVPGIDHIIRTPTA